MIPGWKGQRTSVPIDVFVYTLRNQIERSDGKLKWLPRLVACLGPLRTPIQGKTADSYLGLCWLLQHACLDRLCKRLNRSGRSQDTTL